MSDEISARVFLGMPAVLTARQWSYVEKWLRWLEDQTLEVVRLERDAYSQDPWFMLRDLLLHTDGVALLGFRQLDVRAATWRPHTKEEAHLAGWWTSPWLHLEAGMAVALGLPVLVAPDEGVEEGVFSPDVWSNQVHSAVLNSPGKAGMEWLELVRGHRIARKHGIS